MSDIHTKRMTAAELLIIILSLGTVAAISVPRFSHSATMSRENVCQSNIEILNAAIELYSTEKGCYPENLSHVVSDKEIFPTPAPQCPLGGTYLLKSDHSVTCTHQ